MPIGLSRRRFLRIFRIMLEKASGLKGKLKAGKRQEKLEE
jgi:hypothetical protein